VPRAFLAAALWLNPAVEAMDAMPLYEYECGKCGRRFEALVSVQRANTHRCECGGRCRRLISPPALIFKGSGFYTTDYARKGSGGDGDGNGDGDKKPETKPAEKAESAAGTKK
jgi:putative FmdB family regulatory protein